MQCRHDTFNRQRHRQGNANCPVHTRRAEPECAPDGCVEEPMGLMTFKDADGTRWRVWKVETPASRAHLMDASFRTGWLVFEREDEQERRRLSQVPEDWESLGPDRLNELRQLATMVTTPRFGVTQQSPTELARKRDR